MKNNMSLLLLTLYFCLNINGQNYRTNACLPKKVLSKIHHMYNMGLKEHSTIVNLSKINESKHDGVYSFRLSYRPHYSNRMFILYKEVPYSLENIGFEDPVRVIEETCNFISSLKLSSADTDSVLVGLSLYIYEEYGLNYGAHNSAIETPDFHNELEKEEYYKTKIKNIESINKTAIEIVGKRDDFPNSIITTIKDRQYNKEEAIALLGFIAELVKQNQIQNKRQGFYLHSHPQNTNIGETCV